MLQALRRVAGMACSVAGNLVRKEGKNTKRNYKSNLSATILGSFTGKKRKYSSPVCEADSKKCIFLEESVQHRRV